MAQVPLCITVSLISTMKLRQLELRILQGWLKLHNRFDQDDDQQKIWGGGLTA
jgi:hypothetical protein